jgi:hypothetical protein
MIRTEEDAVCTVLELWDASGIELPTQQRELALSGKWYLDSVRDRINAAITSTRPSDRDSVLLAEIDEFYVAGKRSFLNRILRRTPGRLHYDVIQLISPLVWFDEIIEMQSIDGQDIKCLSHLDLPRNAEEAERVYAKVLELADTGDVPHSRAQMLFATPLRRGRDGDSELWQFQKHCLETCPASLLEVVNRRQPAPGSVDPTSELVSIQDPVFLDILADRGRGAVRRQAKIQREYVREQLESAEAVRSDAAKQSSIPVGERVSADQAKLVALLTRFEEKVLRDWPDLRDKFGSAVEDEQIEKLNKAIAPLRLTEDIEALYKWRNGFDTEFDLFGFPGFVPLQNAFHEYGELGKMQQAWSRVWYPLSSSGGSYRLTLLSDAYAPATPIYFYDVEDGQLQLEFESLLSMVETYEQAYEAGIMTFSRDDEQLDFDGDALEKLRLDLNPSAYPNPGKQQNSYDTDDPDTWLALWRKFKADE